MISTENRAQDVADSQGDVRFAKLWLLAACIIVYGKFLQNPIVFDDLYIMGNEEALRALATSLFKFDLRWFAYATFGWVYKLVGLSVVGQRVLNLALHALVVLALHAFFKQILTKALPMDSAAHQYRGRLAFIGALIFAVHPVAVYGVGYLIERSIIMATLFSILALNSFLKGLSGDEKKNLYMAALWYFLAVFSKEHVVMLPLGMLAMVPLIRNDYRSVLKELSWPVILNTAIAVLMLIKRQGMFGLAYEPHAAQILSKAAAATATGAVVNGHLLSIVNQGYLFINYLLLWLFPNVNWMSMDIQKNFPDSLFHIPETIGFLLFLVYPVMAIYLLRKGKEWGLAGYALLFPWMMFFTEFVAIRIIESFVLYRSYFWMISLPLLLPIIISKVDIKRATVVLTGVSIALTLLAWNRLNILSDDFKVWNEVVEKLPNDKVPGAYRSYLNRGVAYVKSDQPAEAMADFNKALELRPSSESAYNSRGALKLLLGRNEEAYEDLTRAIEIDKNLASAYLNRGIVLLNMGLKEKALGDILLANSLEPKSEHYKKVLEFARDLPSR